MRTRFFVFLVFLLGAHQVKSQGVAFEGLVLDEVSKQPLPGAAITIHELNRVIAADENGRFIWQGLKPATYHFHISYIGYSSLTRVVRVTFESEPVTFYMKPTSIELREIVVESNHYKTGAREHTLPIEIIDADYLRYNRKGTLINSMEDLPGINAINTGVGISKPVIRGMSFNRVIVNDRGIKQEGQQWGLDHGLEIDMFDPGRVEVIKGPGSLLYGSDGLGGVINIFPAPLPHDSVLSGSVQSIFKTNNQLIGVSAMTELSKGQWVYRLRLSTQDFGDYQVPAQTFIYNGFYNNIYGGKLKNTAGNERNFSAMVGIKKNWGYSTLTVSNFHQNAGLFAGAMGIPRSYQLTPDESERDIDLPRQQINHFKIISNTNILIGNNWAEIDLGYQNNYRREESFPHAHGKGPRAEGNLALGLRLQTLSLNARYFQHPRKNETRIVGLQIQHQENQRDGFEFLLPDFNSFSAGIFFYEEYTWAEKFTITGGIRSDYAHRLTQRFDEPIYSDENTIDRYYTRTYRVDRNFFNLSGAAGISYYPNETLNTKLNIGTSYRVPTAAELSMNGIHHGTFRHELGDHTLKAERGVQADVNVSVQRTNFSLVVSPFFAYYDQYIYLKPSATFSSTLDRDAFQEGQLIFQYTQHDAVYAGGELSVEYHPVHNLHIQSAFEYVYNYNLETGVPLPFTPPLSVYAEVDYELPVNSSVFSKPKIGASYKRFLAQNRVDRNEATTPGYALVGINAGFALKINNVSMDWFFAVHNLADERYFNHISRYRLLNLPEQGRNFTISVHIPFSFQ